MSVLRSKQFRRNRELIASATIATWRPQRQADAAASASRRLAGPTARRRGAPPGQRRDERAVDHAGSRPLLPAVQEPRRHTGGGCRDGQPGAQVPSLEGRGARQALRPPRAPVREGRSEALRAQGRRHTSRAADSSGVGAGGGAAVERCMSGTSARPASMTSVLRRYTRARACRSCGRPHRPRARRTHRASYVLRVPQATDASRSKNWRALRCGLSAEQLLTIARTYRVRERSAHRLRKSSSPR